MSPPAKSLPLVTRLPAGFSIEQAFQTLVSRNGVLWLDSAARGPDQLGRYSFLTAEPLRQLTAYVGDPDPWSELDRWCRELPSDCDPTLPPFQGGIAGVIGYEAANWLEAIPVAPFDDTRTPAIALGLYDWTIAVDHVQTQAWLICQGLSATGESRWQAAQTRRDQVLSWLADPGQDTASVRRPIASQPPALPAPVIDHATRFEKVTSNFAPGAFAQAVQEIVRRIRAGDSFQVNLAQRLVRPADCSPESLYHRLRRANPAPFAGYYSTDHFSLLSSSPEGFLTVRDSRVQTRPIKGTVPRTGDEVVDQRLAAELSASGKERAENLMIVDLMRNDLSRVCEDRTVVVRQLCQVERYQYVQHLVSVIEGELQPGKTVIDLLRACFPGGSVTGAPKIEAMRTIAQLEPHRRGPYCGSLGYIGCGGATDFNILIRCIIATGGNWYFPVGGGITARSQPAHEEAETWTKAQGMLHAIDPAAAQRQP